MSTASFDRTSRATAVPRAGAAAPPFLARFSAARRSARPIAGDGHLLTAEADCAHGSEGTTAYAGATSARTTLNTTITMEIADCPRVLAGYSAPNA
eukprot:3595778-Prymnesium_polylepis.2